jgi:hypothetical protein
MLLPDFMVDKQSKKYGYHSFRFHSTHVVSVLLSELTAPPGQSTDISGPGLKGGSRGEDLKVCTSSFAFASSLHAMACSAAEEPISASLLLQRRNKTII